jgi:hypothetical protein
MTLTANQYFQIAQGYAKAAEDPFVTADRREALSTKAEWFDFLGRWERGALPAYTVAANSDMTAYPFTAEWPRPSKRPLVIGAVLCLIGTGLFTNTLNFFGENDRQEIWSIADKPHVISPDPHSYESASLTVPASPGQQEELSSPSPPPEPIEALPAAQSAEMLKVAATATIREGPSISAKKIGTAIHGAALRVKGREANWVQFVDPATGNTAWIHSSLVRPNSGNGTTSVAGPPANATSFAPPKSKVAKKRIKQKPSASIQASKQRPSRPDPPAPRQRAYADLPNDEVLLPPRRPGPRFLTKRRMLKEGAMSPGLLAPRP